MRLCLVLFACGLALGAARATAGQTINLEPVRDLLAHAPTLGAREIEQVLQASREAIAGKTFRFTPLAGTPGPATAGRRRRGSPRHSSGCPPSSRCSPDTSPFRTLVALALATDRRGLTGRWKLPAAMDVEELLASGETARFQVFPSNPGVETTETLWVDEKSLLPLRIEMTVEVRGSGSAAQVQSFDYETGPDLGPPKGVRTPDCIDSAR